MQYLSYALPLAALVSGSFANPLERRGGCQENACLAAVTGKAALGDDHLRGAHCASFLATTVTPPAVTVTETVTDSSWADWKAKRGVSVTVCPNEVPNYASACDNAAYTSACSCFGFTEIKTTTVAPTTTTKTVYVAPTGGAAPTGGSCAPTTVTKTLASGTTCPAGATTTVTVTGGSWGSSTSAVATTTTTVSSTPSACIVTDSLASGIVANFSLLLEYTSYAGQSNPPIPAGRGYKQDVSDATLASDFSDISDSINFMAGFSLGSVTFPTKQAFDYGQGVLQPEVSVSTLNVWHDCNSITWRWRLTANPQAYPVNGINYMIIDADGKIKKNYAEFDNGAWLQSFGQQCATKNVTVTSPAATKRWNVDNTLLRARGFQG
ncbi:uncharacterized protein PV06_04992 [Exophiala oligosperma]|uniref:NTF2-like domain-containing protein n=2 Tax=Chaetothyriales TaxID=34395 RepID=A0A0D2AVY3_9EURO|nr:uncharacterized protein PV06_04992 [Exophiala oligosperma]KAJ9630151.1 hypothetical protein H2204_008656 [Knufia peltigerae]KIW43946.1 hypothetical protein PV06_04992 [Exophiala oligosperma]